MYLEKHLNKFKIIKFYFILIIILINVIFNSCNLFFSSPHGRENIFDDAAQITAFTAVPSSDKSIMTMWNWKEPPSWLNDERITDIQIQHSILGYPDNYIFFASDSITDKSMWQKEWTDLIPGITHYFSLFARIDDRDNGDIWLAPIKVKAKLPGTVESGLFFSRQEAVNIDNAAVVSLNPDPINVRSWEWAVIYFDIPDDVFIVNATINVLVGALSEITFAALDGFLPEDDWEKWNQLQDNSIVNEFASATFNINQASYNITEVVRAASIGPEKAILIKTTDASNFTIDNNASAPLIIADIIK